MTSRRPPTVTAAVAHQLKAMVGGWSEDAGRPEMEQALRLLAKWRSQMLANTYVAKHGVTVMQGPFAGMTYLDQSTEGALIARLLGCYEADLQPHIAAIVDEGLDCILDIGCAEGYYAVGLARRYPHLTVYAHDISETAQAACRDLAERNNVADRVIVGGLFEPQDFEVYAGKRVMVLLDAEGAEVDVLRPDVSPALASMKLVVETHDVFRRGALATLVQRFNLTHDIVRVDQSPQAFDLPPWLAELSHLDQVLAGWEWRQRPTPWLVMRPRAQDLTVPTP